MTEDRPGKKVAFWGWFKPWSVRPRTGRAACPGRPYSPPPSALGPYCIVKTIRQTDQGGIFLAHVEHEPRLVLLKSLDLRHANSLQVERFERERRILSQLNNPHTVRLLHSGQQDHFRFLCLEYIDGQRLDELTRHCGGFIGDGRTLIILLQLCSALAEVHANGLVHRDVTPANVLTSQRGGIADWVTLLDFGLSEPAAAQQLALPQPTQHLPGDASNERQATAQYSLNRASASTAANSPLSGTPAFIAPEVALLQPLDARCDIYATGCLAYFLLSGRPPFESRNPVELCWRHAHHGPPPLDSVTAQPVASELSRLVMACLEKAPTARPQSMRELQQALERIEPLHPWTRAQAEQWWAAAEEP
jgi:eukaryotic-like serine/threonine-protein kinase